MDDGTVVIECDTVAVTFEITMTHQLEPVPTVDTKTKHMIFTSPKKDTYFCKHNKTVASHYWAGFLQKKSPFYYRKDRQKWYIKLQVPASQEDQLWKLLNAVNTIRKVRNGVCGTKCVMCEADRWKKEIDNNYKLPLSDRTSMSHIRAYLTGWLDSGCNRIKNGTVMSMRLTTERKKPGYDWLEKQMKRVFMVELGPQNTHTFSDSELFNILSQVMLDPELRDTVSDQMKNQFLQL